MYFFAGERDRASFVFLLKGEAVFSCNWRKCLMGEKSRFSGKAEPVFHGKKKIFSCRRRVEKTVTSAVNDGEKKGRSSSNLMQRGKEIKPPIELRGG